MLTSSAGWLTFFVIVLIIAAPFLILLGLFLSARQTSAAQQKETQRLLKELIELEKENNRLLQQKETGPTSR